MKIRQCFVSNSSSSSYVVKRENLTEEQERMIIDHIDCVNELKNSEKGRKITEEDPYGEEDWDDTVSSELYHFLEYSRPEDGWNVEVRDEVIELFTYMDNFDMGYYLENIVKVSPDDFYYSRY